MPSNQNEATELAGRLERDTDSQDHNVITNQSDVADVKAQAIRDGVQAGIADKLAADGYPEAANAVRGWGASENDPFGDLIAQLMAEDDEEDDE